MGEFQLTRAKEVRKVLYLPADEISAPTRNFGGKNNFMGFFFIFGEQNFSEASQILGTFVCRTFVQ